MNAHYLQRQGGALQGTEMHMNRTFALAAASSIALGGCELTSTNDQAADIAANAPHRG